MIKVIDSAASDESAVWANFVAAHSGVAARLYPAATSKKELSASGVNV